MNEASQQLERHYAETGPLLRAYFQRESALGGCAEDLLQETFLRAWRHRDRLRDAVSPRAYLFGIARHVRLDALRRRRTLDPLTDDVAAELPAAPDERLIVMRAAIAALPDIHREPLLLKLQQELSYAEIAAVLELPIGTVRSRLHYAVTRLHAAVCDGTSDAASSRGTPLHET